MLSDWEGWEKTLNDGQRQELESMLRFEPDREAAKKRFAGVAYVAATTGTDAEEVSRRFEDWYLPAFTIDETVGLGRKEPVKDAGQFFDLLKDRASNNRARLDALLSAQEAAFRSAIADGDDLADFSAWQATQDNEEAWQGKAREAWQTARRETLERLGPDGRGLAARVVRSLRHEMGVAVEPDAWINQTREMLVDLKARDAEKYELVLAAAKAFNEKQQQPDKGIGQGVAESFGRGAADLVAGLPRALVDMSQDAAEAAVRAGFTNAPDSEALADKIKAGRDVDEDLRDLARGVIDPVKSKREGWAKYAEESLYLAAGSAPTMFGAMLPGGQIALAGMFTDEAYKDMRQAGFTGAGAAALAVTSGIVQGQIERASEALAGVPAVARWLAKWGAKPGSSWAGQFLMRSGMRAGVEFGEEFAQQVTTPALQELGAALTDAVPDRPEGQKLRDVVGQFFDKENAIPLALSVLPLGMIGAAASTGRDLEVIEAVMRNPRYLRAVMSEEKARAVMEEPNADKRAELIREGWQATPTPVIVERVQAIQQEERKEAAEVLRTIQEAERAGMIPTIRRGAQGWTVEKDGVAVPVSTREEAVAMAYASLDEMERKAAEATAQLADEFMAAGGERAEAFEISRQGATVQSEVEAGRTTPEQARRAVELYGQMHGLTAEEASAESLAVLGNNRMEQVEGVRTAVSRIFGGGNVLTAIHEGVHGRWNAGLERGHYSHAMGVSWVRMAEQASGWQFLPTRDDAAVTPAMLDEAIVEVAQADLLGRRKDGKQHFTPGLISRGVASFALAGRAQAKEAGKLATFLKAWREFWGQVLRAGRAMAKARREGKLGDDFDVLLDDLLGTEPQQRFEAQAAREAADMAAEIDPDNMPFSLAPGVLNERIERAATAEPLQVDDVDSWRGITGAVRNERAKQIVRELRDSGPILNIDRNKEIHVSIDGVKHWASFAADPRKAAIIGHLRPLFEQAVFLRSEKPDARYNDRAQVKAFHRFALPVRFGDEESIVYLTVKEDANGRWVYDGRLPKKNAFTDDLDGSLASAPETGADKTSIRQTHIDFLKQRLEVNHELTTEDRFSLAPTDPDKFRVWFRESKVTDAQGKPLVVYHGAPDVRGLFSEGFKSYSRGSVFFAAADYRAADTYADDRRAFDYQNAEAGVIPLFLSIQNPMEIDAKGARWRDTERFVQEAKDKGHDGIIIRNVLDDYNTTPATKPTTVYAFFSSTQAKSALTEPMRSRVDRQPIAGALPNSGEFSPADPRLSFSLAPSYGIEHRPRDDGPRAFDLAEDDMMPADVYDHPEWYSAMEPQVIRETMAQVRKVKGKPKAKLTIYRAGPKPEFNGGDWVSLSKEYARTHAMSQAPGEYKVWAAQVAAEDVRWSMDDLSEFGYFGERVEAQDTGARFSLAPRSLASVADSVLASQMRKPEFREKYLELARQRLDKLRQDGEWRVSKWGQASQRVGTDTLAGRIRTSSNIEAERKFRQRSRQRELIDEGMAKLTPETLAAYEQGLTTIEDDPLVSQMLDRGKLMSKTEAAKAGKLKTDGKGNAGDYDGAPWLPPSWYAGKGRGYMPDQMAQELHAAGLLKDAYPDTLWDALGRAIGSARAQNEAVRKAQAAVRAIEKNAAEQSRADAEAWAKEERAKVPSAKDRQMAALRTLDVILSAFPPVVRGRVGGFVKLASLGSDAAREAEILRRLEKLDEVLEDEARKHYAERIDKLFERAKPKKEAGKKPQGKLGPDAQRLVDLALGFSKLTAAEVTAERAAIAARMENATGPEVVDLLEREQLLDLFGALDERTAAELETAHDWLADTYQAGRNRWRAVVEARALEVEERREEAREDIGKLGLDSEQQDELARAKKMASRAKGMAFSWLSFEQVVQSALGRASKLGRSLVRKARAATNAKTDAMRAKRRAFRDAMAGIFGTTRQREWQERLWELSQIDGARAVSVLKLEGARVEERTVPVEIVERIIAGEAIAKSYGLDALTVDILEAAWAANEALPANRRKASLSYSVPVAGKPTPTRLSQLQAVHVTMLARQADYAENMAGHGWTADVLKEIEAQLSDEAKAIRAWLADQYRGGYDSLNAVYSRMYGVNLPRLVNYAPGTFEARDMMGAEMDPYGQGLLSEGGFRAGMLKTRAQHRARPRLEDALAVYWGHVNATEHFKAFGEFARDLRGVLNEASVRASIKAKGGATLLEAAQKWVEAFERNGLEARSASKAWDEFLRKRQSSQAFLALAYNLGTLMKQSTAALGALLNMGPTAGARQFGRLLTGQLELGASYRSAVIQRRLDAGYSPEVRQAMAAMMADRPTWASAFLQRGMETIGLVDAVFTTASHAMAWDYHFSEAKAGGLTDAQARQVADLEAEATVARTAQPSEMMDRSLGELGMAPMARFLFMFATEARQKAALALEAYSPSSGLSKGERAMRLLLLHAVFPLAIQTVTNLWRDARDDDDDELFDEDNWRGGDYLKAMLLGPVLGLPLIGGALNAALTPVFGGHYFANDPTQPLNKAATGAGDIFEAIEEGDLETGLKGARSLLWALALAMGGEKSAGLGVGANILYDAFRVGDNALGEAGD